MTHRAIQLVPTNQIVLASHLRKRVKKADISQMAATIRTCGVIQPGLARQVDGKFELIVAALRFLGAKEAGLATFPVEIADRQLTRAEIIKLQYVENETRVALNPMESARGVCEFQDETGLNGIETAAELGIDDTEVSRCRERVYEWCPELQELVESGRVPKSTGHIIHKIACPEEKQKAMRAAAEGQLPRDAAIAIATQRKRRRSAKSIEPVAGDPARGTPRRERQSVRRLKSSVAGGSVTITSKLLTPDGVIAMLAALLARAQELASAGLNEEEFFTGLHEVRLESFAAAV